MPERVRIGFVGCGSHAALNLYPALAFAPVELVSVCDSDSERLDEIKARYGPKHAFASVDDLIKGPPIEAVIVCGPPSLHQSAAIAAMNAGLHVFTEKPPAPDVRGALEVQAAAQANKRHCMTGFMKRYALRYQQAHQIMRAKRFGSTTHVLIKYAHWNYASLYEMLVFMTVHALDLFRFFLGDLARITIEKHEAKGQYSFTIAVRARSGVLGTLITSSQEPRIKEHVEITGEGELVVVHNVVDLEYHRRVSAKEQFTHALGSVDAIRPDFGIPNPEQNSLFLQGYAGEIIDFAGAVLDDRPPRVTIDDGVIAMRLAELLEHAPASMTADLEE